MIKLDSARNRIVDATVRVVERARPKSMADKVAEALDDPRVPTEVRLRIMQRVSEVIAEEIAAAEESETNA